ncbi:hypothetical protein ABEX38_29900 [Priestia megaterium]
MYLDNKSAKKVPKKNLFNVDGGTWDNRTGTGVLNLKTIDQYFTSNPVRITAMFLNPLIDGIRTYALSWNSAKFNIAIAEIDVNGIVIADFGWKLTPSTYTFKSNAKYFTIVVSHKSATNISIDEAKELNFQMEAGTATTAYEPYGAINSVSKLVPKKNMLQDIDSIDTSSLWTKELASGVDVVKTGEKFQGATVYRMTFKNTTNARVMQLFTDRGYFSASVWIKFVQFDTTLQLMLREKGMGTVFGQTIASNPTTEWQRLVLPNVNVTKDFLFGIYKAGGSQFVVVDVAMPQLEKGSVVTEFEPYAPVAKQASLVPKKNLLPAMGASNIYVTEQKPYSFLIDAPNGGYTYTPFSSITVKPNTQYTLSYVKELFLNDVGVTVATVGGTTIANLSGNLPYTFNTGNNSNIQIRFWRVLATGSKVRISNFQLEEGSVATPFASFELAPKKVTSPVVKAPYRKYPFSFKRETVEVFNGVQYGYNNPRIKNGGLFLEEYTFNLLSGKTFLPNNPTTIVDKGDYYLVTAGSTSNFQGAYLTGVTVKAVTTYTLSAKIEELGSAKGKIDFVIEQTGGTTIRKKPVKFGDRYYITFTTGSGVTRISTCFYLGGGVIGDAFTLGKDVQLEERSYPTTPANSVRKADDLQIPVAFDKLGGSIEMEFDYHYSDGATQYLFDTNPEERWLIYKETYDAWILYTGGVSRGYLSKNPVVGRNKLKLSWTATDFTLVLNGEQVAGKAHSLTGLQSRIFLGQRYTIGSHLDDVIYSVVIKDRNGNIQFKF